jgi:hypothetical protein
LARIEIDPLRPRSGSAGSPLRRSCKALSTAPAAVHATTASQANPLAVASVATLIATPDAVVTTAVRAGKTHSRPPAAKGTPREIVSAALQATSYKGLR